MARYSRLVYSIWYYFRPPWDSGITPPEVVKFVQSHPPGKALDMGCGTGTNSIYLAQNGWDVTGIDFAPRAIRKANHKIANQNLRIEFKLGDVTKLEFPSGKYDFVIDIGCFHSLTQAQRLKYLDHLNKWLATGGRFLIYAILGNQSDKRKPGIHIEEIDRLEKDFHLISKQEGVNLGTTSSVWLEFIKR